VSAAELGIWVALIGGILMGAWRLLRVLVALVKALESVGDLSRTFGEWTEDMREWQGETDRRIVRLETLQMVGDRS